MERRPVVFASLLLLLLTSSLSADSNIRSVRVSFVQGSVLIDHGFGKGFEPAMMNMPVTALTRFRTGDDGLAEIEFENGSTLRLTGETEVLFPRLSLLRDGRKMSLIVVRKGTVYFGVRPDKQNVFNLNGETLHLEFGKQARLRMTVDAEQVFVAVFKGTLVDTGTGLRIGKNQSFKVDVKKDAIVAIAKGIDEYTTDAWDRQMDEQHKRAKKSPATFAGFTTYGGYSFGLDECGYSSWGLFSYWMPYCVNYYPRYYPPEIYVPGNPTKPVTPPGSIAVTIGPRPGRPHIPPDSGVVVSALPNTVVRPPTVDLRSEAVAGSLHRENHAPVQTVNPGGGQWTSAPAVAQDRPTRPPAVSDSFSPSATTADRPSRPAVSNNAPHWTPVTPQPSSSMNTHSSSPQMPSRPEMNNSSHSDNTSYRPTPEPRPYSPPPSPPPAPSSPPPVPSAPASGASTTPTRPTH